MLFSRLKLHQLKDQFDRVVIVGSGPTHFKYYDLIKFQKEPIFFINQTHQLSHFSPSPHKYFFTHHISEYSNVLPTTVWIRRRYLSHQSYSGFVKTNIRPKNKYLTVDCRVLGYVGTPELLKSHPWVLNKNEILKRKCFLALFGTITTAIHFAWFCGAKKITFIGCNPSSGSFEHDPRMGGKMIYGPEKVHENTLLLPQYFDIQVEHL